MTEADDELVQFCADAYPRLVGLLALYLGDRQTAEELAQETLVRVYEHWMRIRSTAPSAWANRVALNLASSWWRRRHAERRANARHGIAPDVELPVDPADVVAIRSAVADLPERQRAALVLRYYAALPVADVAAQMRCSEGTVKALTHQAVDRLRTTLDIETEPAEELPHA